MTLLPTTVSDHAILRYLERVRGLDVESIRAEIIGIVRPAAGVSAKRLSVGGFTYILDGQHVITVLGGSTPNGARVKGARAAGRTVRQRIGQG